jgi:hypothetical protein
VAYARRLSDKAALAVQFNYNGFQIAGYGSAGAISAEAGVIIHLSPKLHMGLQLDNPGGTHFGNEKLKLPSVYTIGWGYDLSEKIFLTTEISKEEMRPVDIKVALQYLIIRSVLARAAIQSANSSCWYGVGFLKNGWRLDIYSGYHVQLGASAGMVLYYLFKKK